MTGQDDALLWMAILALAFGKTDEANRALRQKYGKKVNAFVLNGAQGTVDIQNWLKNTKEMEAIEEHRRACDMVEWEPDMGKTIPYCKLDRKLCCGQCTFGGNDKGGCPCDSH